MADWDEDLPDFDPEDATSVCPASSGLLPRHDICSSREERPVLDKRLPILPCTFCHERRATDHFLCSCRRHMLCDDYECLLSFAETAYPLAEKTASEKMRGAAPCHFSGGLSSSLDAGATGSSCSCYFTASTMQAVVRRAMELHETNIKSAVEKTVNGAVDDAASKGAYNVDAVAAGLAMQQLVKEKRIMEKFPPKKIRDPAILAFAAAQGRDVSTVFRGEKKIHMQQIKRTDSQTCGARLRVQKGRLERAAGMWGVNHDLALGAVLGGTAAEGGCGASAGASAGAVLPLEDLQGDPDRSGGAAIASDNLDSLGMNEPVLSPKASRIFYADWEYRGERHAIKQVASRRDFPQARRAFELETLPERSLRMFARDYERNQNAL